MSSMSFRIWPLPLLWQDRISHLPVGRCLSPRCAQEICCEAISDDTLVLGGGRQSAGRESRMQEKCHLSCSIGEYAQNIRRGREECRYRQDFIRQ